VILDYIRSTNAFILRVPRSEGMLIRELMTQQGLDYSNKDSTSSEAVLFTYEPYAAVAFWDHATPAAKEQLKHLKAQVETSWASTGLGHIKCPPGEELWPFQKDGVAYALGRKNTLIGDVPGLGKTAQAICFANETSAKRVLVICPANIRLQWVKMIRRWSTMQWPYHVYPILQGKHGVHPTAEWTIVSYDLARSPQIGAALARGSYDLLVLDEAHYLKTIDTRRTRAVFGGGDNRPFEALAGRCASILALTGTPLPNRPREAYTLARGLCWDAFDFMSEDKFGARFNPSQMRETQDGKIYIDERSGRHGEFQARLRANFMVRREKHGPNGVMAQLKMPIYDIVHVEETGAVKQALKAESLLDIDPETFTGAGAKTLGHIAVVRRQMGVAIAPLAAEYVEMLLEGGEDKIVVFGHHIEVLDIIERKLRRFGVVRIDGRTTPQKKQVLVDRFRQEPGVRVCLGNMLSMGTGTDGLQEVSDHAVFAEADWTPGVNQQGVDRLDRGGQQGTVRADFLVAPGSFSERVLATALRKNQTTNKALDRQF
jgi:SWI/SNF-related matrix-associated actin-dependent regulator of chromatin subfamily A-like protein 1